MDLLTGMAIFAKVVETQSFTAASDALGLSKSAVSKQVSRLEDRLGARLLNRTTRRLSLTEVGEAFYERAARAVAEAEEAELAVTRLHTAPRGRLKVGVPMSFGLVRVGPLLARFSELYPEVALDLHLDDRVVDVVDGGYDLVIRITTLPDSSLIAKRISSFHHAVVATPAYWQSNGQPSRPSDLTTHNCLLYSYQSHRDEWRFRSDERVRVSGNIRANNGDMLCEAALGGAGVAWLPSFIVGDACTQGRLEEVLQDHAEEAPGIYAIFPANRYLSTKVRVFVDFLAEAFSKKAP